MSRPSSRCSSQCSASDALEAYLQQQESRSARNSAAPSPRQAPPPQPIQVVAMPPEAMLAVPAVEPAMSAPPPVTALLGTADALEQYDLILAECAAQLANDGLLNPANVPERLRLVPLDCAPSPPLPHACTLASKPVPDSGRPDAQAAQPEAGVLAQPLQQVAPAPDVSLPAEPQPEDEAAGCTSCSPSQEADEAAQHEPVAVADADTDSEALLRDLPTPDAKHVRAANRALRDRLRTLVPANVNAPKEAD